MTDFYTVLELDRDATPAGVKKAYKRMAQKYHPDKCAGVSDRFNEIKRAYDVLSNPDLRARYDETGIDPVQATRDRDEHARAELAGLMIAILDKVPEGQDILSIMRDNIVASIAGADRDMDSSRQFVSRYTGALSRLTHTGASGILHESLRSQINRHTAGQHILKDKKERLELMLEFLAEYAYRADEPSMIISGPSRATNAHYFQGFRV